mgnify:CR=1 FL=1
MRVVIDTNVVVSAALRDRDPEAVILFVVRHPDFEWVASAQIIEEYVAVLRRDKFRLPEAIIQRWEQIFGALITVVEAQAVIDFPRDQKDAKFLACALAAKADYFITGDKDFEGAYRFGDTTVLSVSLFKRLVCDAW